MKFKTIQIAVYLTVFLLAACSSDETQKDPERNLTPENNSPEVVNNTGDQTTTPKENIPESKTDDQNIKLPPPAIFVESEEISLSDVDKSAPAAFISMPKREASGRGYQQFNTEEYDFISENGFKLVRNDPLSTFSIDVDAASYSNVRRFLNDNNLPPPDAVRIEEMINYFDYEYPQPDGDNPFSITAEASDCPWQEGNKIVHIGLKGKEIAAENLPPGNIVFLIDVSGSMSNNNKLPLLKKAFKLLVNKMRVQDRVAIVVYAGAAGLVLPSTPGNEKQKIISSLENLEAGGSTAGSAGIKLAYETAKKYFIPKGNNRVILATDGDFNVGPSSDGELERLIEQKRNDGIFLTVLGFGMGNYKDSKMEKLADKGNGNYAYIDNLLEAKKVLINEFGGTLFTIAKDVKIQVEFNPAVVKAYRLIGYENRMLNKEDFSDDTKDAGELGSGHTVTALYEVVPAGSDFKVADVDPLKYQQNESNTSDLSDELLTVKFRYKKPDETVSKLIVKTLGSKERKFEDGSRNLKFSAAVAMMGMLLRDSEFKGSGNFDFVINTAKENLGKDNFGYRFEFLKLAETAKLLTLN